MTFVAERCGEHNRGSNRQKCMAEKNLKKIKKVVDKRKEMW